MKRFGSMFLTFVLLISMFLSNSNLSIAATSEGDGSSQSPYLIRTVDDFNKISEDLISHYKIVNDLDFKNAECKPISYFMGTLDGGGYTISNLNIVPDEEGKYIGIFGKIEDATLKNINLSNIRIKRDSGTLIASLVGYAYQSTIENIHAEQILIDCSNSAVGGICASAYKTDIIRCSVSNSKIYGSHWVGGIAGGFSGDGTIWYKMTSCYSIDNDIKGLDWVGGLVGNSGMKSQYRSCFSTSNVTATSHMVGGLIGFLTYGGLIYSCHSTGTVKGWNYVGGLVGRVLVNNSAYQVSFENNYSLSNVEGIDTNAEVGGLVGSVYPKSGNWPTITKGYYSGELKGSIKSPISPYGNITNCYFDKTKTGILSPSDQAKNTKEMYQQATYKNWNFNFYWTIDEGKDYPKFSEMIPVKNVALSRNSDSLKVGDTLQLQSTVLPSNALIKRVAYSSSNTNTATVDSNGLVTAVASGNCVITVTTKDGGYTDTLVLTVEGTVIEQPEPEPVPVTGINLAPYEAYLALGTKFTITAEVMPNNATNKTVTWKSSNPSVVTVSKGTITTKGIGTAVITATTQDSSYKSTCSITVTENNSMLSAFDY